MEWICYLLPAFVSVKIVSNRNKENTVSIRSEIIRFGNYVLGINLLTMCVIQYVLGIEAGQEYLYSFGFATKYMIIALVWAVVLPYAVETIKKYIELTFSIKVKK